MFIGHFAVSFLAKRVVPSVSLGALFLAAQLADLLWPNFVLLGVETFEIMPGATRVTPLNFISYPYSHSLLALAGWGALVAILYRSAKGGFRAPIIIALVVVSHWALDVLSHRPDMPIAFGEAKIGLGLWNSLPGTIAVEGLLFVAAVVIYARATSARDRVGSIGLWALVMALVAIYLANLFGPPPPSVPAVAWSAQAMWLLVAWAFWIDRHREPLRGQRGNAPVVRTAK